MHYACPIGPAADGYIKRCWVQSSPLGQMDNRDQYPFPEDELWHKYQLDLQWEEEAQSMSTQAEHSSQTEYQQEMDKPTLKTSLTMDSSQSQSYQGKAEDSTILCQPLDNYSERLSDMQPYGKCTKSTDLICSLSPESQEIKPVEAKTLETCVDSYTLHHGLETEAQDHLPSLLQELFQVVKPSSSSSDHQEQVTKPLLGKHRRHSSVSVEDYISPTKIHASNSMMQHQLEMIEDNYGTTHLYPYSETQVSMKIRQPGISSYGNSLQTKHTQMEQYSPSMSCIESISPLRDCDGQTKSESSRSTNQETSLVGRPSRHWGATIWTQKTDLTKMMDLLAQLKHLVYLKVSAMDHTKDGREHVHAYLYFQTLKRQKAFPGQLRQNHRVFPIVKIGNQNSLCQAVEGWKKYLDKKGVPQLEVGKEPRTHSKMESQKNQKLLAKILPRIEAGERIRALTREFPTIQNKIKPLAEFRPKRTFQTKVLHLWGPSGVGKSYYTYATLNALEACHPEIDWHSKLQGFEKYWEGYDNEPIVFIDDPVMPNIKYNQDGVQMLKTTMSVGACMISVKYGSMQFDSKLIIINITIL